MSAPPRGIKLTNSLRRGAKATQRVEGVRPNDVRRAAGLPELPGKKWSL